MKFTPTRENIEELNYSNKFIPAKSDIERIQFEDKTWMDKLGQAAGKFNEAIEASTLPSLAGGLLQGGVNTLTSVANIPLGIGEMVTGKPMRLPYADFQQYIENKNPESRLSFLGGELLTPGIGGGAIYNKLEKALGKPSLAKNIALGGATGAAVSGSEEPYSRVGGAVLGSTIPAATGLSSKAISKHVTDKTSELENLFRKEYGNLFKTIEKEAPSNVEVRIPEMLKKQNIEELKPLTGSNRKFSKSMERFKNNPTLENAHIFQSDLGKLQRKLQKSFKPGETASEDLLANKLADSLRRRIKGSMQDYFLKIDRPDLLNKYSQLNEEYINKMVPYLQKEINQFRNKEIFAEDLVKKLLKNQKFTYPGGPYKEIPGMGVRRALKPDSIMGDLLIKALQGGAIGAGVGGAYEAGLPGLGGALNRLND